MIDFDALNVMRFTKKNASGLPQGIEIEVCEFLHSFIREKKIKRIVETGVCHAFSSYIFLDAMGSDGELISIEPNIRENMIINPNDYPNWTLVRGTSNSCLESVFSSLKEPADLFWHDSKHDYETQIFEYGLAYAYNCAYIGTHDVNLSGTKNKLTGEYAWYEFLREYGLRTIIQKPKWGVAFGDSTIKRSKV